VAGSEARAFLLVHDFEICNVTGFTERDAGVAVELGRSLEKRFCLVGIGSLNPLYLNLARVVGVDDFQKLRHVASRGNVAGG
jgi:hypothetical protein